MRFVFAILRHVPSERYDRFWRMAVHSINCLFTGDEAAIVILDDHSDPAVVRRIGPGDLAMYCDRSQRGGGIPISIVDSPFQKGAGEILFHWFASTADLPDDTVVISLHDTMLLQSVGAALIRGALTDGSEAKMLWHFTSHAADINTTIRRVADDLSLPIPNGKLWVGCFGGCLVQRIRWAKAVERRHQINRIVPTIRTKQDRCAVERLIGIVYHLNHPKTLSLLGSIFDRPNPPWMMSFETWSKTLPTSSSPFPIVKLWFWHRS